MGTDNTTPKPETKRGHDKLVSLRPLTEDEALRRLLYAGPLPGKRGKQKQRPHGEATMPKPKRQMGK
jgi:hypothetical protein